VQNEDPSFFAAVSGAMFNHDPIGISFSGINDEYDAEAGAVIPRLTTCSSPADVAKVLHEEFQAWFGSEAAGARTAYLGLARELWALKQHREA
jgi:hypothetical protein